MRTKLSWGGGGSMHGLNAIGNPLVDIKNTMSGRIDKFNTEIDRIHQESNLIVRFS